MLKWFLVSCKSKNYLFDYQNCFHTSWYLVICKKKKIMIVVDNTRNCTIFSLFLFYLTGTVCTLHKNIKSSRISVNLQGYWTKGEVSYLLFWPEFQKNFEVILCFNKKIWHFSADYMWSEFFLLRINKGVFVILSKLKFDSSWIHEFEKICNG